MRHVPRAAEKSQFRVFAVIQHHFLSPSWAHRVNFHFRIGCSSRLTTTMCHAAAPPMRVCLIFEYFRHCGIAVCFSLQHLPLTSILGFYSCRRRSFHICVSFTLADSNAPITTGSNSTSYVISMNEGDCKMLMGFCHSNHNQHLRSFFVLLIDKQSERNDNSHFPNCGCARRGNKICLMQIDLHVGLLFVSALYYIEIRSDLSIIKSQEA